MNFVIEFLRLKIQQRNMEEDEYIIKEKDKKKKKDIDKNVNILGILIYNDKIKKTGDKNYFINTKTGRKIKKDSNTIVKIWEEFIENNKEELINKVVKRKNLDIKRREDKYVYMSEIIQQIKIDMNDSNEMVYIEDTVKQIILYLDMRTKLKTNMICKKWNNYANKLIIEDIYDEKVCNDKQVDRYIMKNISKIQKNIWENIMKRKTFDPWKYFSSLQIYGNNKIIDLFYDKSKQSLINHHYYFVESNDEEIKKAVDNHIKYTRFPLILCIIYLNTESFFDSSINNTNMYKYFDCLKTKKYFDKLIPEDCSSFSREQLRKKIVLYYPDPFCLIHNSNKFEYNLQYITAVSNLYQH